MGIGRFLLSMISPKVLAEETVKTQENLYVKHGSEHPDLEPHQLLAAMWLSRAKVRGHDTTAEWMQEAAVTETRIFACLPPHRCARALGLYILYKENPRIVERYRVFQDEFNEMMQPVVEAEQNGTLTELYAKYNPTLAEMAAENDR